jgi:hypothetical protein
VWIPSYDCFDVVLSVDTVIWLFWHRSQCGYRHMTVLTLSFSVRKQSYDGFDVVLSADTVIWWFWRRSQCGYRHMTVLTLSFSVRIPSYDGLNLEFDHLISESYRVEIKTWNESLNNKSCRLNVSRLLLQSVTRPECFMVYL